MPDLALAERVERIEAHLAIQQLAVRYAMAVDARDMDAWLGCFRPDVDAGRHGTGREAPALHRPDGAPVLPVGAPDLRAPHRAGPPGPGHRCGSTAAPSTRSGTCGS